MLSYSTHNITLTAPTIQALKNMRNGSWCRVYRSPSMDINFERMYYHDFVMEFTFRGSNGIGSGGRAKIWMLRKNVDGTLSNYRDDLPLNHFSRMNREAKMRFLAIDNWDWSLEIHKIDITVYGGDPSNSDFSDDDGEPSNNNVFNDGDSDTYDMYSGDPNVSDPSIDSHMVKHLPISSLCLNAIGTDEDDTPQLEACVICTEKKPCVAIIPCGHRCYCDGCDTLVSESTCPFCGCEASDTIRIYD